MREPPFRSEGIPPPFLPFKMGEVPARAERAALNAPSGGVWLFLA